MKDETKEDYLARHRRTLGLPENGPEENPRKESMQISVRIRNWFYILLVAFFIWTIYQVFGMMDSN